MDTKGKVGSAGCVHDGEARAESALVNGTLDETNGVIVTCDVAGFKGRMRAGPKDVAHSVTSCRGRVQGRAERADVRQARPPGSAVRLAHGMRTGCCPESVGTQKKDLSNLTPVTSRGVPHVVTVFGDAEGVLGLNP